MNVEANDGIHHRLPRDIDGRTALEWREKVTQPFHPAAFYQQRLGPVQPAAAKDAQDHLTLGDEASMAAGHIALAHLAIGCDAWIVRIVDVDDIGQGRDLSHQPA